MFLPLYPPSDPQEECSLVSACACIMETGAVFVCVAGNKSNILDIGDEVGTGHRCAQSPYRISSSMKATRIISKLSKLSGVKRIWNNQRYA